MAKKKNPLVFMDVSIDGDPFERMTFELFPDIAPKTAENFRALCTGEKGIGPKTGKALHYKGSFFHHVIKGSMAQGGDFVTRDGTSGQSIYDGKFPDEPPRLKHDGRGLLSMTTADRDTFGSQFIITFKANQNLDRKYVVFGKLVQGNEVLKKIENVGDEEGIPTVTVKIVNCGEVSEEKRKNKLKRGNDASDAISYEARRKGKHKKSSRDRRKRRRRYYSSDSESSSDSETESSESDSDSDSYLSSSSESDISSSSDDRRKRRKRSYKREKYKHGKRGDRRRDKKRKRHDKRSKRKSKRATDSLTDNDSESKTESSTDNDGDMQGKVQKGKDLSKKSVRRQSPSVVEKEICHRKRVEADLRVKEHEGPKENGKQQSNGIEKDAKSDRSAERPPDMVDDHPNKSRSRNISPKSPRRSVSGSPPHFPERNVSRSPIRSRSMNPARSLSKSPLRGRKSKSISRSPVRASSRRSISRSPVRSRSRRSPSRSPPRSSAGAHSRRSISRSPVRSSRHSISRSSQRSSHRSKSRSSGRAPPRRSPSRSPLRETSRKYRRSYSRSPTPVRRVRSPSADRGRGLSRSVSPDASPKRIRRGRGFSERYSYARRYRTPSPDRSPVRSYRYSGRIDNERYSRYRRYSPRRYRSPPRGRTPPRFRGRRSRTQSPSVSPSPQYRNRRYSRSPIRSRSPVDASRSRASPRAGRRRYPSQSRSRSESRSSLDSQSPKQASKARSRSSSGTLDGKKGLVSYDDGSPDLGRAVQVLIQMVKITDSKYLSGTSLPVMELPSRLDEGLNTLKKMEQVVISEHNEQGRRG
ncbi:hypothetical protein HRI_002954400 [Hibiscus trionum]|uniref:peptidylprolyl isomerase n=1 Tax=Hibiscus trionum TaxID=183268 RepID=A0A9W7ICL1_HIBTR|nr:hypothetical protein HRI_002954400 [Hibiscus trionum]